jgi:hypothetical protein
LFLILFQSFSFTSLRRLEMLDEGTFADASSTAAADEELADTLAAPLELCTWDDLYRSFSI